jgi:hypothetical protein
MTIEWTKTLSGTINLDLSDCLECDSIEDLRDFIRDEINYVIPDDEQLEIHSDLEKIMEKLKGE